MIDVKVLKDHMFDVISAIHEVHRELGSGIKGHAGELSCRFYL